jgi:F0F1-type ATP synthase assembly protein I
MKTRFLPRQRTEGADIGWSVMTTLLGGFAVWGGIGWLLDRWLETRLLTPIGLIVGMALGIYAVVARFGLAAEPSSHQPQQHAPRVPPAPVGAREENE